ncbi:hypothetical protein CROQUDRAFT_691747 [Cronartium quercuum f. sp. fusiforme G11]|uniref:Uncharacterized protein n=1 Tax=Cronartium quercuum f. sp. fusiforme G11 TaxID=708437 RepID=A0A9P6NAE6_9BASI|nr:hypothetical protein CROQUDRAFT_691747 [Cronartium quercuum f. sp. fusiforme G11]
MKPYPKTIVCCEILMLLVPLQVTSYLQDIVAHVFGDTSVEGTAGGKEKAIYNVVHKDSPHHNFQNPAVSDGSVRFPIAPETFTGPKQAIEEEEFPGSEQRTTVFGTAKTALIKDSLMINCDISVKPPSLWQNSQPVVPWDQQNTKTSMPEIGCTINSIWANSYGTEAKFTALCAQGSDHLHKDYYQKLLHGQGFDHNGKNLDETENPSSMTQYLKSGLRTNITKGQSSHSSSKRKLGDISGKHHTHKTIMPNSLHNQGFGCSHPSMSPQSRLDLCYKMKHPELLNHPIADLERANYLETEKTFSNSLYIKMPLDPSTSRSSVQESKTPSFNPTFNSISVRSTVSQKSTENPVSFRNKHDTNSLEKRLVIFNQAVIKFISREGIFGVHQKHRLPDEIEEWFSLTQTQILSQSSVPSLEKEIIERFLVAMEVAKSKLVFGFLGFLKVASYARKVKIPTKDLMESGWSFLKNYYGEWKSYSLQPILEESRHFSSRKRPKFDKLTVNETLNHLVKLGQKASILLPTYTMMIEKYLKTCSPEFHSGDIPFEKASLLKACQQVWEEKQIKGTFWKQYTRTDKVVGRNLSGDFRKRRRASSKSLGGIIKESNMTSFLVEIWKEYRSKNEGMKSSIKESFNVLEDLFGNQENTPDTSADHLVQGSLDDKKRYPGSSQVDPLAVKSFISKAKVLITPWFLGVLIAISESPKFSGSRELLLEHGWKFLQNYFFCGAKSVTVKGGAKEDSNMPHPKTSDFSQWSSPKKLCMYLMERKTWHSVRFSSIWFLLQMWQDQFYGKEDSMFEHVGFRIFPFNQDSVNEIYALSRSADTRD